MLYIHGMGHFFPENKIDNAFIERLNIGSDSTWIMERVGIRSRRTVLPLDYILETKNADPSKSHAASLYSNAVTGAKAAEMALERSRISSRQIGMVICGGCSPQYTIPAEACAIAAELGAQCQAFDLNSACSSFAAQLHFLNSMRPDSLPEYILVVNPENNTRTVDYRDRNTAVLWGDGTAAAVVSARTPSRFAVADSVFASDPAGWNKVLIPTGGHFAQNGTAVQTFAIKKSHETLQALRERAVGIDADRMYFIGHQANLLMLEAVCKRGGIVKERHLYNVDEFGNCGAAGAPGVMSQNWDRFSDGDSIGLVVVGSGLTWGGLLIRIGSTK